MVCLRPLQIDFLFPIHRPHAGFIFVGNSIKLTYSNYHARDYFVRILMRRE